MVVCNEIVHSFLCGLFYMRFERTAQGNPPFPFFMLYRNQEPLKTYTHGKLRDLFL